MLIGKAFDEFILRWRSYVARAKSWRVSNAPWTFLLF
jgi:hypothetical protein